MRKVDVTVNGQTANVTASNHFKADVILPPGINPVAVTATDGSGNSRTARYEVEVGSGTAARTLIYDLNGNLTDDGAGRSFTWDAANRLASVIVGGVVTSFVYDGAGRRVMERVDGVETRRWIWGRGPQPIEERDASNTVRRRFYAGLGEQIDGTAYYYTTDHLGSVRELTDTAGAVRARYDYTPYGEKKKLGGDLDARFGFTGFLDHTATGLNLTHYRAYDPILGRWLSRDPMGEADGPNLYAYSQNDPVNRVDPLGLWNLWNPLTYGLPSNPGENPWNPFDSSAEWGATARGLLRPFQMPAEAFNYGNRNRGCSGNDSDHHAIAVRHFGQIMEGEYGFIAGAFGSYGAGVVGNLSEMIAPSKGEDFWRDIAANEQGFMDYLELRFYPGER